MANHAAINESADFINLCVLLLAHMTTMFALPKQSTAKSSKVATQQQTDHRN